MAMTKVCKNFFFNDDQVKKKKTSICIKLPEPSGRGG